jgi:tetraacyldisaccharide-1-P 4'-kinase
VPLFAFCGVAGPDRFVGSLAGLDLRGSITWPDHHAYQAADLAEIEAQARRAGALALVTTAKDAARLDEGGFSLPLYFCDLDVRVVSGAEEFDLFVDSWFAAKM